MLFRVEFLALGIDDDYAELFQHVGELFQCQIHPLFQTAGVTAIFGGTDTQFEAVQDR